MLANGASGGVNLDVNGVDLVSVTANAMIVGEHLRSTGVGPTCGTNCASIAAGGTDTKFALTATSSGVTGATANFGTPFATTPVCVATASSASASVAINLVLTNAVGFAFTAGAVETIYVHCID